MSIFSREFSSNLGKQFTWVIFLIIISVMTMLAYPIITDNSVSPIIIDSLTKLPESVNKIILPFGLEIFDNVELYFTSTLIFAQFMICIFSLNIGLMSLAKEQGFGTIDYLYINPVSRSEIFFDKLLANAINLFFLVAITALTSVYIYSYVAEINYINALMDYLFTFIVIFADGLLFLALGTFISSLCKRTANIGYIASFVFIILLILNLLVTISVFNTSPFVQGLIPLRSIRVLNEYSQNLIYTVLLVGKLLPAVIFSILGILIYNKKDLVV